VAKSESNGDLVSTDDEGPGEVRFIEMAKGLKGSERVRGRFSRSWAYYSGSL
jgi:hypothetical protein